MDKYLNVPQFVCVTDFLGEKTPHLNHLKRFDEKKTFKKIPVKTSENAYDYFTSIHLMLIFLSFVILSVIHPSTNTHTKLERLRGSGIHLLLVVLLD